MPETTTTPVTTQPPDLYRDLNQQQCQPCSEKHAAVAFLESDDRLNSIIEALNSPLKDHDKVKGKGPKTDLWQVSATEGMLMLDLRLIFKGGKAFTNAVDCINLIRDVAEENSHHPNVKISEFNKLEITIYTHKVGGITENDAILAAKITEKLFGEGSGVFDQLSKKTFE